MKKPELRRQKKESNIKMANAEAIYQDLKTKLRDVVPDVELKIKSEIAAQIIELKKQRNAVILGHNYMEPALYHSIPDMTGDSLELSRAAAKATADIIVFCGVQVHGGNCQNSLSAENRPPARKKSRLLSCRRYYGGRCPETEIAFSRSSCRNVCQHQRRG